MREFQITNADKGQRLTKFLERLLPEAGQSFLYKMLRKKNITLNGKKADGSEQVKVNDVVTLFLSDETFDKFAGKAQSRKLPAFAERPLEARSVVFENPEFLIAYKPAGMLSQKDKPESESINEQILQYLSNTHELSAESYARFRPSICNRLDRNTSGLILFAKTLSAQQQIAKCLKTRSLQKFYLCVVYGKMNGSFEHSAYLTKDEESNTVTITSGPVNDTSSAIHTKGECLIASERISLLKVELITGKSHQIRAVLENLGHPVVGDKKYLGTKSVPASFQTLRFQLLLAYEYRFPKDLADGLEALAGQTIYSPIPKSMLQVVTEEFPGYRIPRN